MANQTSTLDLITQAQSGKEVTANALHDAASPALCYGRRQSTTSGLNWGYYGGVVELAAGAQATIPNGTLTLTASATNYIVAARATGAVTVSTAATNWNDLANYKKLYQVTTGPATVTDYIDHRAVYRL